jgi:diguanylate cyclase (GGDEF)-like protein
MKHLASDTVPASGAYSNPQPSSASAQQRLSWVDGGTGLPARAYFDRRVTQELERSQSLDAPLALVFAAVDDVGGVPAAARTVTRERVLRWLGTQLTRRYDIVCRVGDRELALILPATAHAAAADAMAHVQGLIAFLRDQAPLPARATLTMSYGIASSPEDTQDGVSLVAAVGASLTADRRRRRGLRGAAAA